MLERPRRRMYQLTGKGAHASRETLNILPVIGLAFPAVAAGLSLAIAIGVMCGAGAQIARGLITAISLGIVGAFSLIIAVEKESEAFAQRLRRWRKNPFARGRRDIDRKARLINSKGDMIAGLVDFLLRSALEQIPVEARGRWAEEWADHSRCRYGWRLVWWALCLRATATRTGREYRRVRLPQGG